MIIITSATVITIILIHPLPPPQKPHSHLPLQRGNIADSKELINTTR